jgi:hypothetical protein
MKDLHIEMVDMGLRLSDFESKLKLHEQDISRFYSMIQSLDRRVGQGGKR